MIEQIVVTDLVVPDRKLRRHPNRQIAALVASIEQFGFLVPILVDEQMHLITGHARLAAAQRLSMATVPAIKIGHLNAGQIRAFRIADNRLAELAEWNEPELALELKELTELDLDFSVELTGFDLDEIDKLITAMDGTPGHDPDDDTPVLEGTAISEPGDLWTLGDHLLLCGDSTNRDDVTKLLGDSNPHLMVTDPPYGVEYDPAWRNDAGVSTTTRIGKVANDDRADWRQAWELFPGAVAYVWHAAVHARTVAESLEAQGFAIRSQIIWAKHRFVLGRGDYHWQHEPCFYAVRKGATSHWQGARDKSTLWTIGNGDQEDAATSHGTQKPVECMRRAILNNSARGDFIYEPFAGSGTTLIAAERTGRKCRAMELDARYVDLIIRRWQELSGGEAAHAELGLSFAAVARQRLPEIVSDQFAPRPGSAREPVDTPEAIPNLNKHPAQVRSRQRPVRQ